jgi:hypothetical protein
MSLVRINVEAVQSHSVVIQVDSIVEAVRSHVKDM